MNIHAGPFALALSPVQSVDVEDWVRVRAQVAAGAFSGEFLAFLQLGDLQRFQREIVAMHANVGSPKEAALSCFEPGICVRLVSEQLDGVQGTYRFTPEQGEVAAELTGSFRADQSHLPELAASIQELIAALVPRHAA